MGGAYRRIAAGYRHRDKELTSLTEPAPSKSLAFLFFLPQGLRHEGPHVRRVCSAIGDWFLYASGGTGSSSSVIPYSIVAVAPMTCQDRMPQKLGAR